MRLRRLAGRVLAVLAVVVPLALFALWRFPTSDFLFLPNRAQPLTGLVSVEGGHTAAGSGGIYYLDVTERQATWLERLLPFTRPDGATLVPNRAVVPSGVS